MLLLWWCPFKIQKEKQAGLLFTSTDYLSIVLIPFRIHWTIPLTYMKVSSNCIYRNKVRVFFILLQRCAFRDIYANLNFKKVFPKSVLFTIKKIQWIFFQNSQLCSYCLVNYYVYEIFSWYLKEKSSIWGAINRCQNCTETGFPAQI